MIDRERNQRAVVKLAAGFVEGWAADIRNNAEHESPYELEWILERLEQRTEWLREEIVALLPQGALTGLCGPGHDPEVAS